MQLAYDSEQRESAYCLSYQKVQISFLISLRNGAIRVHLEQEYYPIKFTAELYEAFHIMAILNILSNSSSL